MAFVEKKYVPHFTKEEIETIHATMDIILDLKKEDDNGDLFSQIEKECIDSYEWQWLHDMLLCLCDNCELAD